MGPAMGLCPSEPLLSLSDSPLCRHLVDNPALVRGRRVLELGSGTGLCGIVAAKPGAAEVR